MDDGEPAGETTSEATRYLCAGVHLDGRLAEAVIHEIEDDFGARVASDGVDLGQVARHAVLARRRQSRRDLGLVAAVLVFLAVVAARHTALALLILILVPWAIVTIEALVSRYSASARALTRPGGERERVPGMLGAELRRRIDDYAATERGNVTVYRAFNPFVGSGTVIFSWSLAVDISKATDDMTSAQTFDDGELHDHVMKGIRELDWSEIWIEDRVFVPGNALRDDRRLLPDPYSRPVPWIDRATSDELITGPQTTARRYLCVRYQAWGDELVVTTFVRFVVRGRSLFVEASFSLLPPVKARFHEIDDLVFPPSPRQLLGVAARAAKSTPRALLACWGSTAQMLAGPWLLHRRRIQARREISQHRSFDYGLRATIRERAADTNYHRYFQRLDKEMCTKVVEKRILDSIVEFLRDHRIDTRDFEERGTTILNNGLFVSSGASVSADTLAVGSAARAQTVTGGRSKEQT